MNIIEAFRVAFTSLRANKLRAVLTMLGVIIGVAAVIALLALGSGLQRLVVEQFQGLGSNLIFVFAGTTSPERNVRVPPELTNEDVAAIADSLNVPAATAVAAEFTRNAVIISSGASHDGFASGVTANYPAVRNARVTLGSFFDEADVEARSRVAVLGANTYATLFHSQDPIGQRIRINGVSFEVIGVMEKRGAGLGARDDDKVYVPLSTAQRRLFPPPPNTIRRVELTVIDIQIVDQSSIAPAIDQVTAVLRQRHNLTYQDSNFTILTQEDFIATFATITRALTLFLGAIAAISLLVGGIGIMNIMLVSVTERTREIGLRKAVGARRRDIMIQFLIEALALSVIGGAIGIGLGAALSRLGTSFLQRVASGSQAQVEPRAVVLATLTSLAVGIIFGLYPAVRAARLNPIDALRYE